MIQTISVLWLVMCSDVMDYCRKVSPLEGSNNWNSLLKKLVCVCVEIGQGNGGCASMCMCRWVGIYECVWMCTCMCMCRWVCVCVDMYGCMCMWVGRCVDVCVCACMCMCRCVCVCGSCMEKGRLINVCVQFVGEYFWKVLQILMVMNYRSGTLLE